MVEQFTQSLNAVTVLPNRDEWKVSVVEAGRTAVIHFLLEAHARTFAGDQRVRLGIASAAFAP